MSLALSGLKTCAWAAALAIALGAAAAAMAAGRVPVPKVRPSTMAGVLASDPLGALLREQGLVGPADNLPVVIGLKLTENGKNSRFTLEFSDSVDVRAFTLAGPDRVVLDMPDVLWRMPDPTRPSGKGAVKAYRYGQFRKGNGRLSIDLNTPVKLVSIISCHCASERLSMDAKCPTPALATNTSSCPK